MVKSNLELRDLWNYINHKYSKNVHKRST